MDDGVFEGIARLAIGEVIGEQVTSQVLVGTGSNDTITGLWSKTGVQNVDYGAAATDFDRNDVIDWFDNVRLSKTDGMMFTAVMGDSLWKLCEKTPRGTDGTSSAGYTDISQYLLEINGPHMGTVEGQVAFHYADLTPASIVDPGLFYKSDRVVVWFWGSSLDLEYVPQQARKDVWKMCAEVNMEAYRPAQNVCRIKRT